METKELDNQNRVELLENLKVKCKSIVKRDLYIGLIVWFFVILLMIFYWPKPDSPKNVFYSIFFIYKYCAFVNKMIGYLGHSTYMIGMSMSR